MIIKRVLNNNTIIVLDEKGEEIVVKGKGIAFGKKVGQAADETKVEKVFRLDNKETIYQYQTIIKETSDDVIEVAEEIIEIIKASATKKINDKIYITLTDHISNLLERISLDIRFDSSLLWNVQALYPEEYQLAVKAVEILKRRMNSKIPDDEANFIAIHIVNSEMDLDFQGTVDITNTINEIMKEVTQSFPSIQYENDRLNYSRFVLHMRFLLQRILQDGILQYNESDQLVETLIESYPQQAACVSAVIAIITKKYQKEIEGERLFLLIHIIRLTTVSES